MHESRDELLYQFSGGHRHRHHAVRLHPAVAHVQVLGVQVDLPLMRLQMVEGLPGDVRLQAEESRLHLGEPRAEGLRVVPATPDAARNGAGTRRV